MFMIISRDFVKKIDQPYFNSWSVKNIGLIINHIINKLFINIPQLLMFM